MRQQEAVGYLVKHSRKYRSVPAENQCARSADTLAFSDQIGYLVILTIVGQQLKLKSIIIVFYIVILGGIRSPAFSAFDAHHALDSLRQELATVEAGVGRAATSEEQSLAELDASSQKVELLQELVQRQEGLLKALEDSIDGLTGQIAARQADLWELAANQEDLQVERDRDASALGRILVAEQRMTRWTAFQLVADVDSWHEFADRRELVSSFSERHQSAYLALHRCADSLDMIADQTQRRTLVLNQERAMLDDRASGTLALKLQLRRDQLECAQQKVELRKRIRAIQSDRRALEARQDELKDCTTAVENLIARVSNGEPISGVPLQLLKGRLPWPVDGAVVERFGLNRNATLKTVTDNPGIDLAASGESTITAVAEGRVSSVTRLRGFGNVCIIEHPGPFYTVYARLSDVAVKPGDDVVVGSMIGTPQFDGTSDEYRVHFEIWSGRSKQDPLVWLQAR